MNINELILEFIDGTSTPEMDKSLFEQLAGNEVAQQKMKKIMEVENTFTSNNAIFQPSAESVNQVFSKLGMKKAGFFGSLPFLQSNFVRFSLPAVFTTLTLVFLYNYFFIGNDSNFDKDYKVLTTVIKDIPDLNNKFINSFNNDGLVNDELKANSNKSNTNNNNGYDKNAYQNSIKQNNIVKYVYKDKFVGLDSDGKMVSFSSEKELLNFYNNLKNNDDNQVVINSISESNILSSYNYIDKYDAINNYQYDLNKIIINRQDDESNSKLSISLMLSPTFNFKSNPIQPNKLSEFNNLSANLIYNISEDFGLGLEIQQETFLQSFTENDNFERTIIYTQRPNFTNIGFAINYSVLDKINLYGAIGTNTNFSGLYNRIRIGREINSVFPTDFIFGLEFSTLHFTFNENYYNSSKFGLFLGAKLW